MPRKPRVQYPGAVYHVMCRGDHREAVFCSDEDCELFLKTLGEACIQTGWKIHAYVLMGNHYHFLLETPKPNLVKGMQWLQGTYTSRFNSCHQLRGHLFQGRYKALLVDQGDPSYFRCVAAYIHLNPARAGMIDLEKGSLQDYRWSSYPHYITVRNRPEWLHTQTLLKSYQQEDTVAGRRSFKARMQRRLVELKHSAEPARADEEWDRIRRGWFLGGEEFRKQMLTKMDEVLKEQQQGSCNGPAVRDHGERDAEHLLSEGLRKLALHAQDLHSMRKGDINKKMLAWFLKRNTRVSNAWIAKHLCSGHPSNLAAFTKEVEQSTCPDVASCREKLTGILK